MAKQDKAYFGLPWIVSIILAFFFGALLAPIVRFMRGNMLMGVISLILLLTGFFAWVFWIVDLISIIVNKDVKWLA